MMRGLASLALVLSTLCLSPGAAGADEGRLRVLLSRISGETPAPSVPQLLLAMAEDAERSNEVLERATEEFRALTDSVISFVAQTEPQALRTLPGLHVAHDFEPPEADRPPMWSELRWQGVQLLRRIAPDPAVGRDVRLRRDFDRKQAEMVTGRSAEIAGLVLVFTEWWVERGHDPALTHDPARIPDVTDWLEGMRRTTDEAGAFEGVRMLAALDGAPRRRFLVLRELTPTTYAHLAAECVAALRLDNVDLPRLGIEARRWDPEEGRLVGHDAPSLWNVALAVLDRVTSVPTSGADAEAMVLDRLGWWRRARFEARYWRDPRHAPTLKFWLTGVTTPVSEGGPTITGWLRTVYLTEGFRDLVVEQIDEEFAPMVAELVPLLSMSREQAIEAGFDPAYRRMPLRARSPEDGLWVSIPWEAAQELVRELLVRITGADVADGVDDAYTANLQWRSWWASRADEPGWYRDPDARSAVPTLPDLDPPRARIR